MGLRDDAAWMYEKAHEHRYCSKCEEIRTRDWYAANDTRIGGGNSTVSHSMRTSECSTSDKYRGYPDRP